MIANKTIILITTIRILIFTLFLLAISFINIVKYHININKMAIKASKIISIFYHYPNVTSKIIITINPIAKPIVP